MFRARTHSIIGTAALALSFLTVRQIGGQEVQVTEVVRLQKEIGRLTQENSDLKKRLKSMEEKSDAVQKKLNAASEKLDTAQQTLSRRGLMENATLKKRNSELRAAIGALEEYLASVSKRLRDLFESIEEQVAAADSIAPNERERLLLLVVDAVSQWENADSTPKRLREDLSA